MLLAPWKTESDRPPALRLSVAALFAVTLVLAPGASLQAVSGDASERQPADPPTRAEESSEKQKRDEQSTERSKSAEEKSTEVAGAQERADEVPRFTNDDLPRTPRMYESQESNADDKKKAKKKPGDEKKAAAEARRMRARAAELRVSIAEMEARLSHLERRTMAIKNPLLAGRTPADDTEAAAVGGLSAPERLNWVENEIAATRQELENARAELATLRSSG